jgi:hypothetical protein
VTLAARALFVTALAAAVAVTTSINAVTSAGASGTTRYVSPAGSDANPGTQAAPFATLATALHALQPGDTLLVRGGTYVENVTATTVTTASAAAPIRVAAYPGERPVLQGLLWLRNPSWWTFDGLNVTWNALNNASQHMVKLTDGSHWRFTNAEVWGAHSYAAILVAGAPADWSLDHLFVHDTYASNGANQDHLIYVNALNGGAGGVVERNVLVRSVNGRAVKVGPSSSTGAAVGNLLIRYNTMADNGGPSNVQVAWATSDVTMYRNIMTRPAAGRSAITAYELSGTNDLVADNIAWDAAGVLDAGVAGLVDNGGNAVLDPQFAAAGSDDYHPTNPAASAYGAYAPSTDPPPARPAPTDGLVNLPGVPGYHLVAADGGIFAFGDAPFAGSTGALRLNQPIAGMAGTPTGNGYWLVASDGGIFAFGDARFAGSTGASHLNAPIVGMAATPTGNGYWLVASDGGIFAFGDARFAGSTGALRLNQPIVGMAATPTGNGYWLVARDGGIFAFGDARFAGSTGALRLNQPIVGMAGTPTGNGYWLVARDGGIFTFGDATFHGSTGGLHLNAPIVGMLGSSAGHGYRLVASDGGIFAFGDSGFAGSAGAIRLNQPIVGMSR